MKVFSPRPFFSVSRFGILAFFVFTASSQLFAQSTSAVGHKTTFTNKDIFGSAVFLDNNNIISDYQNEKVIFYTRHDHLNAYFTQKGLIYEVQKIIQDKKGVKEEDGKEEKEEHRVKVKTSIVQMTWAGANEHAEVIATNKQSNYYTYLKKDSAGYKSIKTFGYKTITYKNLYPGIDVEYSFPEKGGMKYNLLVKPGADVSVVKMVYNGRAISLKKDKAGNVTIHTKSGDIVEHAPVSISQNQPEVNTAFSVSSNTIQFSFPHGYDANSPLLIDPWVTVLTTLPPVNMGFSSDYDYSRNLFAYGAGATYYANLVDFFQVAKYSGSGSLLWVFNGTVPAVSWTTADPASNFNFPGGFIVDKVTGKTYVGQGFCNAGTTVIRLNPAGQYDNFISAVNSFFQECWGLTYNCLTNSVLAMGGGTNSNLNMGVINTATGAVSTANITGGLTQAGQDILAAVYDTSGNLYAMMNQGSHNLPFINTIYAINGTYNGNLYAANSGFTPFDELLNAPYWNTQGGFTNNWSNALAANGSYLYYYDGFNVAAHAFATGAMVGTPTTIAGYTPLYQDGIAVDNCNHVYVGGKGVIKTFTFNGAVFTPGADIPLGAGFQNDTVHDVRYNSTNNLLYVTGSSFVGTYNAILSTNCNPAASFTVRTFHTCDSATAEVTPALGLTPQVFTYIWTDSSGNIVNQTTGAPDTLNTITGLHDGTYHVQVQWNANCGGATITDSTVIHCSTVTLTTRDTTICAGQPVTLSANPSVTGGTYSWSPAGQTTASITVSPTTTSAYTVTYTPPTGAAVSATIHVTVNNGGVSVTVNSTTTCPGDSAILFGTPSITGGTYSWNPGGFTSDSIHIAPTSTTIYTLVYTSPSCGSATGTGTVTVGQTSTVSVNSTTICPGDSATLTATPSNNGGTYSWAPGGFVTNTITVSPGVNTVYSVTYSSNCGTATATGSVTLSQPANVTVNNASVCNGDSATLTATPSITGGTYSWAPGGNTTSAITVTPGSTGVYTVTYTSGCGTPTATGTVTVFQPPLLSLTQTPPICSNPNGGSIVANASGGLAPYQYALNAGAYQTVDSFNNLIAGSYTVLVKDGNGCTASSTTTLITPAGPTISLASINTCLGASNGKIVATPAGGNSPYQYALNSGAFQLSDSFTSLASGAYTVQVMDANGCTATSNISIQPITPALLLSADSVICFGGNTGQITATGSGGSAPYQYSINAGAYQNGNVFDSLTIGNYSVQVQDANGCTASSSIQVFQPNPITCSVQTTREKCPGYHDGTITFTVTGGNTPYSYSCTKDGINFKSSTTGIISALDTGSYFAIVTDKGGCSATINATIPSAIPDVFSAIADSTSCNGQQYTDGSIHVTASNFADAPFQYSLNNGPTQLSGDFEGLAAGSYNITVINDSGCISTIPAVNVYQPAAEFAAILPADTTLQPGKAVVLSAYLSPHSAVTINSYQWSPFAGLSCIDCANPVASPYGYDNTYSVTITYNNICTAAASATILVEENLQVYIPNCFTPNGDGNNDVFLIYGQGIKTLNLKIFNRWGEKVFESNNQFLGWDGTFKNILQEPAVFVYETNITFLDDRQIQKKGSVTLVR